MPPERHLKLVPEPGQLEEPQSRRGGPNFARYAFIGAGLLAAVGVFVGANKLADRASGLDKYVAAESAAPFKTQLPNLVIWPSTDSNVIIVEYTVLDQPSDLLLSEVAADMHIVAPEDQTRAVQAIRTYLLNSRLHPGQKIIIYVDAKRGTILPSPNKTG